MPLYCKEKRLGVGLAERMRSGNQRSVRQGKISVNCVNFMLEVLQPILTIFISFCLGLTLLPLTQTIQDTLEFICALV